MAAVAAAAKAQEMDAQYGISDKACEMASDAAAKAQVNDPLHHTEREAQRKREIIRDSVPVR